MMFVTYVKELTLNYLLIFKLNINITMRRRFFGLIAIILLALFTDCSNSKKMAVVNADANTDAEFGKYKSYTFASQVDNQLDEGLYFLNDLAAKAMIRDAVQHELGSRGYDKSQGADMVVNFRVFDKPTEIVGFTGLGDDYWGDLSAVEPDNRRTFNVEAGTLMVHLVDKETGKLIWQGFASGIMEGDAIVKDKTKIQQAVSSIFDQFNRGTNGVTR